MSKPNQSEIIARLADQLVASNPIYKDCPDDARVYWENQCETYTDALLAASNHGLLNGEEQKGLDRLLGWHNKGCPYGLELQQHTSCTCFV